MERLVTLNVNGQQRRVDVMKQETLATTLRYKLGLTGTKLGCDRSECGACTVLIDDVPHYSCSVLTHTARGKQITTIEGLASADGTLHPVQQGVDRRTGLPVRLLHVRLHHGDGRIPESEPESNARRTGPRHFRQPVPLPGLRQDPHRDDARRRESEKGELRCQPPSPHSDKNPNYKLIGQNYTTPDLVAKVTGSAKYAEDYRAEGMLFAKLLLSPVPHAHIRSIDTSEALAMPGVKAILTVDDLPAPADAMTDLGQVIPANKLGERGLTNDPVYQGEPILAVCAVDEFTCAEAIEKIKIDYERLPHVVDPLVSLRPGAPNATSGRQRLDASGPAASGEGAATTASARAVGAGAQVDRRRISRMPRTASSPWASPPIIGRSAIGKRDSRTPTWFSTKLL